jgi:signal transduction histidine kinase
VDVSLKVVENELIMHVEDDGIGLKGDEMNKSTSLGLLGMRERVAALDGTVEFGAGHTGGTAVTVRIPREK